jgi:hypothetical protein
VVQCWNHGRDVSIKLNYGGEVHRSAGGWENNYMSQNAVLKSLREIIERNPRGWEQEISLKNLYAYFLDPNINRLGDLRSVLETQQTPLSMEVLETLGKIYGAPCKHWLRVSAIAVQDCWEILCAPHLGMSSIGNEWTEMEKSNAKHSM